MKIKLNKIGNKNGDEIKINKQNMIIQINIRMKININMHIKQKWKCK